MSKAAFSIYNASAGSGKTYMLVKEYLKILLQSSTDDAYKKILAITFTNKAVGEMKRRIITSLSDFAKDEPGEKAASLMLVIAQETGLSLATVKDKAKSIIKNIIHNYAAFDISTIDKFTHKVIRAFAHDLNLSITFDVSLETDTLLQEAVDAIIAKAGESEILTGMLVDFSLDKADNDKSWDVTYELYEIARLLVNENHRGEIGQFQDKPLEEFLDIKAKLQEKVKQLEQECVALSAQALKIISDNGIQHSSFFKGLVPKHFEKLQKGVVEKHTNNYKYLEEGNRYGKDKPHAEKAAIDSVANDLHELLKAINKNAEKHAFYQAFLKNITPLSLLNSISIELERIQKEQNVLSISEFNAIIHREIQNQPAPFIYERLGERYRHFFIDEFQDTSQMQWNNLIPLIDNALAGQDMAGDKGSLMVVGDPKQSIYRWRGGRAEQFIAMGKGFNPFSNPDRELLLLGKNFRSYCNVINFNNDFFSFLSGEFEDDDYRSLYRDSSTQETNDKQGGYVNISFIPETIADDEAGPNKNDLYLQATLGTINKVLAQGFSYRDIVLLTRKRQPGVLLANYLTENGIPILSSETLLIENSGEVKLIISLLRYLKSNDNIEAKAHFLYFAAQSAVDKDKVHDFIRQGMEQPDEEMLENWLAGYGLAISFRNCRKKSLYEAVETIVSVFLKDRSNQSYVQYFLDLVLERDVRVQSGIADFLDYWDNNGSRFSIPSPEGKDAVRLMTIHKSKGLEFPVVIFPFAEEDYARAPRSKMWLDLDDDTFGFQKALIDSKREVAEYGEKAAELYMVKSQEELLDNINILYVALTRAEEQLYIITGRNFTSKGELTNNMSSYFIKFLQQSSLFDNLKDEYEFGAPVKISGQSHYTDNQQTIKVVKEHFSPRGVKIAQRESLMWGTNRLKAIEFGNVMHEILSYITTQHDIPVAIMKAIENGLITIAQQDEVAQSLRKVLLHPNLTDYFSEGSRVFNEQNIIKKGVQNSKPDRVTVKNGLAYLLDYKTGTHLPKYERQLTSYQQALEEMGYKVAGKALIYIGEEIEVVHL